MSSPRNILEEQFTVPQLAERLSVDDSTVWRWISAGEFKPVYRLGRRVTRIPASAVNRFLAKRNIMAEVPA